MKAYLFIETGEIKLLSQGDWYANSDGEIYRVNGSLTNGARREVARHEIEIPDGCETLILDDVWGKIFAKIPIPRKQKIKKWRWAVSPRYSPDPTPILTEHLTDKEVHYQYTEREYYHRIDETEIEVDE